MSCGQLTRLPPKRPRAADCVIQSGHEFGPRAPLPNDVAALRAMLVAAWAERDTERAEKAQLAAQNDHLRHLIRQLQRLRFGPRSEKLDPDQLNLTLEDVEQAIAETEAQQEGRSDSQARPR